MGFFSGITKAIGGALGAVSEVASPIASAAGALTGNPLLTIGGNLAGTFLEGKMAGSNARDANKFSAQQSATGYQRAVADMKAAGLNPMLAYTQGPASSPSAVQAQTPRVQPLGSTALEAKIQNQTLENMDSQNNFTKAQTLHALETAKNVRLNSALVASQLPKALKQQKADEGWTGTAAAYGSNLATPLGIAAGAALGTGSAYSLMSRFARPQMGFRP